MVFKKVLLFVLLVLQTALSAQNKIVTVVDANSGESIPYATIKFGSGTQNVSNSDGKFSLPDSFEDQSTPIEVSYIGFESQKLTFEQIEKQGFIIKLVPAIYELNNVNISDKKEDVNAIMAKVNANLNTNYGFVDTPLSNTVFLREQNAFQAKQFEVEITESAIFSKKKLKEINAEVSGFASKMKKNPPKEFKDFLGVFSVSSIKKDGKTVNTSKLNVKQATQIVDESRSISIDDLEKTSTNLFLKHLDTTKFYRAKSGWFGSRDTISFSKEYNKNRNKKRQKEDQKPTLKNLPEARSAIITTQSKTHPIYGLNTNFFRQTEWYHYTLDGAVFTDDYKLVYVIKFRPKKSKAKYEGTLYVSENDYAVVKATYQLAKGKTLGGLNLKWILGIKVFENVSSGTLTYKENPTTQKYYLQYANLEEGQYFYLNRPLKFIEIAEVENVAIAFDLKGEGNMINKTEYLNFEQKEISEKDFANIKENSFNYLNLKKYDPKVWKEFTNIEPAEELKQYSTELGNP